MASPHLPGRKGPATRLAMLALLVCAVPVAGQDASIQGLVTSEATGQPLAAARVALELEGEAVRSVGTDPSGPYLIGGVAPGAYTLRIQSLGYAVHEQAVTLVAGQRATVTVRLETAPIEIEGVAVQVPEGRR